jgi:hypothetical protein
MYVIHAGCDAEMRVVEEAVFQGYDFSAIGTPNANHYVKPRIDTVRWYECPDCKARIRASEIIDGIRFCNGGRVEINGKTFMTGLHRVVWHGGQETPFARYKRLACEVGVNCIESPDCPPGQFFATNSAYVAPNVTEGGSPLTVEHLKGAIARIRESLGAEITVPDNRMFRVGDQVLVHNVNDGFSNRVDWSGAEPPASYIDDVYDSWDVEGAARSFQLGNSISDAVHELNGQQMLMRDMYGVATFEVGSGDVRIPITLAMPAGE